MTFKLFYASIHTQGKGGLAMKHLVDELIKNAQIIYKLYEKIKNETSTKEKENLFLCLNYAINQENKYLTDLTNNYQSNITSIYSNFLANYGLEDADILSNYLTTKGTNLIFLRIAHKLKSISSKQPIMIVEASENSNIAFKDDQEQQDYYSNIFNKIDIFSLIEEDLELEIILRFLNCIKMQKSNDKKIKNTINNAPYDLAFLHPELEQLFLRDNIINPSYQLFLVQDIFEAKFDADQLQIVISNYCFEVLDTQIRYLLSKRMTLTKEVAFLRTTYITSLLSCLTEDIKYRYLEDHISDIEDITYNFPLVLKLKKVVQNILLETEE